MLDDNDRKEISHIMKVVIEGEISPKFDLIVEGYQSVREQLELINEKLVPMSRIEELEHDVSFLKMIVRQLSDELQQLKKA